MLAQLLVIAGVAGVAYWWGTRKEERSSAAPSGPIPPIPEPLPPRDEASSAPYEGEWAQVPFAFSVAPASAGPAIYQIPPPATPEDASVAPGCTLIVVGEGWWDRAGDVAAAHAGSGSSAIVQAVIAELLPECRTSQTLAASQLRAELWRRLRLPGQTLVLNRSGVRRHRSRRLRR